LNGVFDRLFESQGSPLLLTAMVLEAETGFSFPVTEESCTLVRKKSRSLAMILPLIQKRRSIRKYQERKIEPDKIQALVEAALRSPSSMGYNPWEFVVVDDPDLLDKLSKAKPQGSVFIKNAPLGIVVCADPERSSVWVEDASIACTYIQLTAESLGLASCWIQIRDRMHDQTKPAEAYIAEVLSIPKNMKVEAMIALGYPEEQKAPHGKEELLYGKVHHNTYGKPHNR